MGFFQEFLTNAVVRGRERLVESAAGGRHLVDVRNHNFPHSSRLPAHGLSQRACALSLYLRCRR